MNSLDNGQMTLDWYKSEVCMYVQRTHVQHWSIVGTMYHETQIRDDIAQLRQELQ